ncbi:MAG: response regulator [Myxococcota bacterium]
MKRVLIVDDEPLSATVIEMFLSDRGHPVATAHSGGEAEQVAGQFRPEVLLTDYRLGDMSAAALIGRLQAMNPSIQAIVLTGLPPDQVSEGLAELGSIKVFTKPTELDEIAAAIEGAPVA